ncbi:MAG: TolC family protein [Bryobacterales bacterium]|nr:TolC family protein [Bryobacterales bacterium]
MSIALLVLLSFRLPAQDTLRLTLDEAEKLALLNHPQIAASRYLAQAAAQVPVEIRGTQFPIFTGAFSGVGTDGGSRIAAGGLNNPVLYNRIGSGVALSQTLYDFGRTSDLIETAKLRAQAQDRNVTLTRDIVILSVRRAYFAILRAAALVQVAEETVKTRQVLFDQVDELARNRLKSDLDVRFASVNLADAKLLLATSKNQHQAALADLAAAMGIPQPASMELAEAAMPGTLPDAVAPLLPQALRNRPEAQILRFEQSAAERFVRAEHKLLFPTFGLLATTGVAPVGDDAIRKHYGGIGLNVTIPIFNGWQFRAREAQADFRAKSVERQIKDLENRIERDVKTAYLAAKNAEERMGLTAQLMEQARLALDLAQGRYELGLSSIVELSQAQLNMTTAQIANTNSRYDYQLQRSILDFQIAAP